MKRLVIIVDALRYDYAGHLGLDTPAWSLPTVSYASGTRDAFAEIERQIRRHRGHKIVFTAGFPQQQKWQGVELHVDSLFFLSTHLPKVVDVVQSAAADSLILVHDYWVHNYWTDVCPDNKPKMWWKNKPDVGALQQAYKKRIHKTGVCINCLRRQLNDVHVYVTADHGEMFWEDGKSFGHGPGGEGNRMVYRVPIIGLDDAPVLNYTQLFTGRHGVE